MALDGKFVTDDNANFRHDELQKYQEKTEIEKQAEAIFKGSKKGFQYTRYSNPDVRNNASEVSLN